MNEQIALVKKWLANKDSVSQEELEANSKAAYAAAYAAWAAYDAAAYAAWAAALDMPVLAAHYVTRYEDLTNEV